VTWIGLRLIHAFALTDIARMEGARVDVRVVGFAAAVTIVSALVSGIWPAIKSSRVQVSDTLKLGSSATAGSGRSQIRDLLAITEIAAAVTLLVASGLVVKSFVLISRAEWGFTPDHLLLIEVRLPKDKWRDQEFHRRFSDDVTAALRDLPGIERVVVGPNAPIRWGSWRPGPVRASGQGPRIDGGEWRVGPGHFATIDVPILEGREFSAADDETAPPRVVVGRALARRLWPNQSAVGKRLEVLTFRSVNGKPAPDIEARMKRRDPTLINDPTIWELRGGVPFEVIGVVGDVRMFAIGVEGNPIFYVSTRQIVRNDVFFGATALKALVRTAGPPTEVAAAAKARIQAIDSSVSFDEIVPVADLVSRSIGGRGSPKLMVLVGSVFGALALGFATIGIYGVVAHNVAGRLREIGIRMALGADRREVVRMVVGYAMRLLTSGLALGVTVAWAATRGMRALLFATTPTDPATYAAVIVTLSAAAVVACVRPLRTALRFDPVTLFKA
jgi:putative ABC transport system permease protein